MGEATKSQCRNCGHLHPFKDGETYSCVACACKEFKSTPEGTLNFMRTYAKKHPKPTEPKPPQPNMMRLTNGAA